MAAETLKRLGLTPTEIKVYEEIMKIGKTTIGPVIKRTGLHRGTVYNVITSLVHKGILLASETNGTRYYKIAPLTIFKTILDEKKKEIEEDEEWLDKALKEMSRASEKDNKTEVEVFYGADSFKDILFKMYDECALRKMEYLFMGRGGEMMEAIGEPLYKYTQKRKKELGIKCRIILDRETIREKYNRYVQGHVRYAESRKQSPLNMWVFGESVMLVLFTTKPLTTIMIKNALVATAFRNYFEVLWEKIEGEQKIIEKRHFVNIYKFIERANESLDILDLCCMEPIHEGRNRILNLARNNKKIRILVSNPYTAEFRKRVRLEEQFIKNLSESRILFELKSAIANLIDIEDRLSKSEVLKIRFFSKKPNLSIIILDRKELLLNNYGRSKGKYGSQMRTLLLNKNIDLEYNRIEKKFEDYWNSSIKLDLKGIIKEKFDQKL